MGTVREAIIEIFANPSLGTYELDPAAYRRALEERTMDALLRLADEIDQLKG